ncbi:MAG: SMC-Scp complex subunit ScpB [Peptococcaceae bacterium]|nr:SMC-Scp complex subunit ScpB [Peptococcaceae bacterium]
MFRDNLLAALEAVLFVAKDPLPIAKLSEILGVSREEVAELLAQVTKATEGVSRGITLVDVDGGYKFATKPGMSGYIERLYKTPTAALSRAALEVLSIIAFRQPVTRGEIDFLRGVNSDRALASLLEKDLIVETGRKDAPGRPRLFKVTEMFLLRFGLKSLEDLPDLETLIEQERAAMGDETWEPAEGEPAEGEPTEGEQPERNQKNEGSEVQKEE